MLRNMNGDRGIHLELDVDFRSGAPVGTLVVPQGDPADFSGWLGLLAALESVRASECEGRE